MTRGVILVMVDSLRQDHLGCYGAEDIHTPNLDRFADESAVFDRNYAASYPTVPNRHDMWTGRYNFLYRGWTSLEPDDITLPGVLGEHGIQTQLIYDTPPVGREGFTDDVDGWEQIRGYIGDGVVTDPINPELPAAPHKIKGPERTKQYLRNRSDWQVESDYITPRTFTTAIEWLERNRDHDEFFLTVDAWGPHEQFDPPDHYTEMYDDSSEEVEDIIYAMYGHAEYMSEEERKRIKARYAGEVTLVDTWMGRLLETIDVLDLLDDVMVIFTSDHGHLFGEHGLQGKPTGIMGRLYEISIRTPLLVRHPDGTGSGDRIDAITQPPDLTPTVFDFFDVPVPDTVHGSSILPILSGEKNQINEYAFSGRFPEGAPTDFERAGIEAEQFDGWVGPANVQQATTITGEKWALICHPDSEQSELYDLDEDPHQQTDVRDDYPSVASEMREALLEFMEYREAHDQMLQPIASGKEEYQKEALAPSRSLYTFCTERATYAYPTKDNATRRSPPETSVKDTTFGELVERDPKALVFLSEQYYWAEELK